MIEAVEGMVATVAVGWFVVELAAIHLYGKAGMPTKGNALAHWFYDRRK